MSQQTSQSVLRFFFSQINTDDKYKCLECFFFLLHEMPILPPLTLFYMCEGNAPNAFDTTKTKRTSSIILDNLRNVRKTKN